MREHQETWRMAMNTRSTALAISNASGSEPVLKYVQANGVRFAYLEQGSGPLVMFLHGFPTTPGHIESNYRSSPMRDIARCRRSCVAMRRPRSRRTAFSIHRPGQGSRSAHRGAERRRTGTRRWHGLGRHVDVPGAVHGARAIKAAVVMNTAHPITIPSLRSDPDSVRSVFHVYFFTVPGAHSAVNIEGLPFVDYLWKLWSPTFQNDEHLSSVKATLSCPGTMKAALKYYNGLVDAGVAGRLLSTTCRRRR